MESSSIKEPLAHDCDLVEAPHASTSQRHNTPNEQMSEESPCTVLADAAVPDQHEATQEEETQDAPQEDKRWYQIVRPWLIAPQERRQWFTFSAFWIGVVVGLLALVIFVLPKIIDNFVIPTINAIQAACNPSEIGIIVISGATLTHLLFLPRSPFLWLAAAVFSFPIALLLAEISQAIINTVGFYVGRRFLQQRALGLVERWKYVKAALLAVNEVGPFKVVLLLQLSPFPSEITQYIIGIPSEVTFLPAFVASMIGSLPGNILTLIFGRNLQSISAILKGDFNSIPTAQLIVNVVSLASAIIFVTGLGWAARRALSKIEIPVREPTAGETSTAAVGPTA